VAETRSSPECKKVEEYVSSSGRSGGEEKCGSCPKCYMLETWNPLWTIPSKLQQLSYCLESMLVPLTACKDSIMRHMMMNLVLPPTAMGAIEMLKWWQYSFGDGEDAHTLADYTQRTMALKADWEVDDSESQTTHRHTHLLPPPSTAEIS
jgi:hypothetical protein